MLKDPPNTKWKILNKLGTLSMLNYMGGVVTWVINFKLYGKWYRHSRDYMEFLKIYVLAEYY